MSVAKRHQESGLSLCMEIIPYIGGSPTGDIQHRSWSSQINERVPRHTIHKFLPVPEPVISSKETPAFTENIVIIGYDFSKYTTFPTNMEIHLSPFSFDRN